MWSIREIKEIDHILSDSNARKCRAINQMLIEEEQNINSAKRQSRYSYKNQKYSGLEGKNIFVVFPSLNLSSQETDIFKCLASDNDVYKNLLYQYARRYPKAYMTCKIMDKMQLDVFLPKKWQDGWPGTLGWKKIKNTKGSSYYDDSVRYWIPLGDKRRKKYLSMPFAFRKGPFSNEQEAYEYKKEGKDPMLEKVSKDSSYSPSGVFETPRFMHSKVKPKGDNTRWPTRFNGAYIAARCNWIVYARTASAHKANRSLANNDES